MDILGNALKFTETGHITIRLSTVDVPGDQAWGSSEDTVKHIRLDIQDTGRGMTKEFIAGGLFTPFVQENALSVGTGLGLSIVQQLAKGLGGRVEVDSEPGMGTTFSVFVPYGDACSPLSKEKHGLGTNLDPKGLLAGRKIYLPPPDNNVNEGTDRRTRMVRQLLVRIASGWLGMITDQSEPVQREQGDLILRQAIGSQGSLDHLWTIEVVDGGSRMLPPSSPTLTHPFAPKTVATALLQALRSRTTSMSVPSTVGVTRKRAASTNYACADDSRKSRKLSIHRPAGDGKSKLHLLLVDDNNVNLKVLAMTVGKLDCSVVTASDGQEAVEAVINTLATPGNPHFDWIFMDMSMPVMDGATATRKIRSLEKEFEVARPARIVALTALSGEGAKDDAGCDIFLSKPVSIDKVRQLLREGHAG